MKDTQRILSWRSLIRLEAKDVSLFPVSPAMFLREDISCDAWEKNDIEANHLDKIHAALYGIHEKTFWSYIKSNKFNGSVLKK